MRKKYLRDAKVLQQGLIKEPDNSRYVFYLAQSWRDAGEPKKSLAAYDRRAGMAASPRKSSVPTSTPHGSR